MAWRVKYEALVWLYVFSKCKNLEDVNVRGIQDLKCTRQPRNSPQQLNREEKVDVWPLEQDMEP